MRGIRLPVVLGSTLVQGGETAAPGGAAAAVGAGAGAGEGVEDGVLEVRVEDEDEGGTGKVPEEGNQPEERLQHLEERRGKGDEN